LKLDLPPGTYLKAVSLDEWEQGVHGDPFDFVEHLLGRIREGSFSHSVALALLQEPERLVDAIKDQAETLRLAPPGKGEEYEQAVLVHKHLTETAEGKQWLKEAKAAAQMLVQLIQKAADSEEAAVPVRDAEAVDEEQRFRDDYFSTKI
jgi:hypothetical protein